jgi:hypothetical protein
MLISSPHSMIWDRFVLASWMQRAELFDVACQPDVGEDLGEQLGRWAVHDGVRCGDDEARAARHDVFRGAERQPARCGHVPLVDLTP